jgi:hypothetical protein
MRLLTAFLMLCSSLLAPSAWAVDEPQNISDIKVLLEQVERQLAESQARMDDLEPELEELVGEVRKKRYGGSSNPEVSGSYGALFKDIGGYGLTDKQASALVLKMDVSMLARMDDGSNISVGFGPAWTPGAFPVWVTDDTDEERKGTGTASRLGTLLGTLRFGYKRGPFSGTAGFQSFQTSVLTLSGPLSFRPILFDKNPYMTNITSKAYYENQFLTGVPKRSPEESEHYIMGIKTDLLLPADLSLMTFVGHYEGFYDNDTVPREYGGVLALDKSATLGGRYKFIGFNRSNDTGEILARGGNPQHPFYGLSNNTVFSLMADQKLGATEAVAEVAQSWYDDISGLNGGVHTVGMAWRAGTETPLGSHKLRLAAYGIAPGYLVVDPTGKSNANGTNMPRYRDDPDSVGGMIPQTVVGDPTLPINNTTTYSVGGQLRFGNAFLNINLQNSQQQAASDARIWAAHFLGGSNLANGTWFSLFNNNYASWLPPSGTTPAYGTPSLEREFFHNPRREGPAEAFPTTFKNNAYNMTYAPVSWTTGALGYIPDKDNRLLYHSYHQLETNLWRRNFEGIVNADPLTGQADLPSVKSISNATADMRMNLADWLPLRGRALFLQVYGEILTVNDASLFVPSLDPKNLFVQSILDGTLVYNMTDSVNLILNLGMETWLSDRLPQSFVNNRGELQKGTLEYHDRAGGVGFDWNAYPGRLSVYFRAKLLSHHDSSAAANNFQARQLWVETKSYF